MKLILALVFCVIAGLSVSAQNVDIATVPMYGGYDSAEFRAANEKFITSVVAQHGTRAAAAKEAIRIANQYIVRGDLDMAMKRFNQAWLLDPQNASAFAGFAMLTTMIGKYEEADGYYATAEKLDPKDATLLTDHALLYLYRANNLAEPKKFFDLDQLYKEKHDPKWTAAAAPHLARSIELAEKAAVAIPDDEATHVVLATAYFARGNYAQAWQSVKTAESLGGKKLPAKLIKSLSKYMPRPAN
jgi:Tfp pilus assembly protein PilF